MNTKKQIYTKDKGIKVTFRCDSALSDWLRDRSNVVGMTPSGFVRQCLFQQMYGERTIGEMINKTRTETAVNNADNTINQ